MFCLLMIRGILICLHLWSCRVICQSDDFLGAFIPDSNNVEKQMRRKEAVKLADSKLRDETNAPMNHEMDAIASGKSDYLKALAHRKNLLCVSFVSTLSTTLSQLNLNMGAMQGQCDWAVVFYEGLSHDISSFCDMATDDMKVASQSYPERKHSTLVHCKRMPNLANSPEVIFPYVNGKPTQQRASIPKSVLYQELLPYMPSYHKVFIMDEDTSLLGFNIERFMHIWHCSFNNDFRPLIVQPVIHERTPLVPYVHAEAWTRAKGRVFASSVGLVEQQVPFFDATFLEWFVRHVLVHTREVALAQGVDQSLDRTWCRAAALYAAQVMHQNYTKRGDACAVIVGGPNTTAVHHLNTRALQNKRANRDVYRQKAQVVNDHYKFLFPTWVQNDVGRPVNPLDKMLGKKYRKYLSLNNRCVEQYALEYA